MVIGKIGVLLLDTDLYRPIGDIGNQDTFTYPVLYEKVKGATIEKVVKVGDKTLIDPFIHAAKRLEKQGVQAITTSCGFLALFQKEIAKELKVPFFSSSLMQIPFVYQLIGVNGEIGVLTASEIDLTKEHLKGVDVGDIPLVIKGMDSSTEFNRTIIHEAPNMNVKKMEVEMVTMAKHIIMNHQNVKALVLECANMPPYADSIRERVQIPVFDIVTLTNYVYASI
ncbi:aspartate/glutamate racemase family protein [Virgibacillus sp. W0181]|uniref:aspartate/glutamate racemase family protein n=1 Tax=Virgibacillus sp. W0181 TaxID=3391581 RepID=UPI003F45F475